MQKAIDLTLAVVASAVSLAMSWPYWRSFSYFASSEIAWWIYFIVGFFLAVYVFYALFVALRHIFAHEHEHDHDHGDGGHHHPGEEVPHEH